MNREILFRGKRKQDGMWCHGDLVRIKDGDAEIPEEERAEVVYIASEGCFKLKNPRYDYMDDLNSLTASMEIIVGNTYDGIYGEVKRGVEE